MRTGSCAKAAGATEGADLRSQSAAPQQETSAEPGPRYVGPVTAAEKIAAPVLPGDAFWDRPRSAVEIRERLRAALMDELGDCGERLRRHTFARLGTEPVRRSAADLMHLADELVAQARREERARRDGTP